MSNKDSFPQTGIIVAREDAQNDNMGDLVNCIYFSAFLTVLAD
jgi:hypothetical protein